MDSFYNRVCIRRKAARTIFGRTGDMRRGTSHRKQKSITALCLALLLLASGTPVRSQQRVYFVDGYHGGIYGHYPVAWKTRFITDQLAAHPEWRIGLEIEPETWDTVEVRTPADYARFKAIAADRRVEFTNPSYAQPYCYNISGESIIRQFGYGMRKIRSHFPDVEFVTYSVEEPVLHQLPAADTETLRVQIRIPEVSEYLLGRVHGALRRRTGQLDRPRRQFDPHVAAPCLRRAPEKLGVADHGMGQ